MLSANHSIYCNTCHFLWRGEFRHYWVSPSSSSFSSPFFVGRQRKKEGKGRDGGGGGGGGTNLEAAAAVAAVVAAVATIPHPPRAVYLEAAPSPSFLRRKKNFFFIPEIWGIEGESRFRVTSLFLRFSGDTKVDFSLWNRGEKLFFP